MLMFYKGLDPMLVRMTAYYRRKDRKALLAGRDDVESTTCEPPPRRQWSPNRSRTADMRLPRPGSAWTPSRWGRRGRYADYVNSKAWAKRRRRWFQEHWEQTHELAVCVVCGMRPVDLHHLDYDNLGDEDYDQLIPICRRDHDRIHAAWEATPHVRRLGRRTATLAIIDEMRSRLRRE